jgi:hypothetical protein
MNQRYQVRLSLEQLETRVTPSTTASVSVVGTYYGGYDAGSTSHPVTVNITNETSTGAFSGTITTTPLGQSSPSTTSFTGQVNSNQTFTAFDPSLQISVSGSFSGTQTGFLSFYGSPLYHNGYGPIPNSDIYGSEQIAAG